MNACSKMRFGLGAGALLAVLVALAAWQNRRLADARRAGLPEAPAYATQAPPFLNFITVGLGGFRGMAAEALWSRADRMQEEGRYLELVQLSDWITWLDPHATEAWIYNAWNMAYNISAVMRRPEDRLRWVAHGIALLRDQGLPANPNSARLYRELAWLYQHKIGSDDDPAHLVYRLSLADAMSPYLHADGTVADTAENRQALADFRLDVDRMLRLQRQFGPLDWRLALSHAVYWAAQGLDHAHGHERLACRRAIYQPLMMSVTAGRFDGDLLKGVYHTAPNPALIATTLEFLDKTAREEPTRGVRSAHALFLVQAIRYAHATGQAAQMQAWYRTLTRVGQGVIDVPPLEALLSDPKPPARN